MLSRTAPCMLMHKTACAHAAMIAPSFTRSTMPLMFPSRDDLPPWFRKYTPPVTHHDPTLLFFVPHIAHTEVSRVYDSTIYGVHIRAAFEKESIADVNVTDAFQAAVTLGCDTIAAACLKEGRVELPALLGAACLAAQGNRVNLLSTILTMMVNDGDREQVLVYALDARQHDAAQMLLRRGLLDNRPAMVRLLERAVMRSDAVGFNMLVDCGVPLGDDGPRLMRLAVQRWTSDGDVQTHGLIESMAALGVSLYDAVGVAAAE